MTPTPPPLPDIILDPIVRLALAEDLGRAGDLTTDATIAPETQLKVVIAARQAGVIAGLDAAAYALKLDRSDCEADHREAGRLYT